MIISWQLSIIFSISAGKCPHDSIGETIKREAANASLRASKAYQIVTSKAFTCQQKIMQKE